MWSPRSARTSSFQTSANRSPNGRIAGISDAVGLCVTRSALWARSPFQAGPGYHQSAATRKAAVSAAAARQVPAVEAKIAPPNPRSMVVASWYTSTA